MHRATVAAGLVRSLAEFAARSGVHQPDILREVGLTESDLSDQDSRIGFETLRQRNGRFRVCSNPPRTTGMGRFADNA